MKKLIFAFCMMLTLAIGAQAQTGRAAVGFDLGVAPMIEKGSDVTNFEIDGKVQYYLPMDFRLEGKLSYGFKDNGISMLAIAANVHYMIPVLPRFQMYPLVGFGYARPKAHWDGGSKSFNRFLFNIGVGGELAITRNLSANIEFKYQYIKDFQRFPISVGLAYKF